MVWSCIRSIILKNRPQSTAVSPGVTDSWQPVAPISMVKTMVTSEALAFRRMNSIKFSTIYDIMAFGRNRVGKSFGWRTYSSGLVSSISAYSSGR